jgi:hypothetical protein
VTSLQSVDYLEEAVTDTVFSRGGEVLLQERQLKSGVHEVGAARAEGARARMHILCACLVCVRTRFGRRYSIRVQTRKQSSAGTHGMHLRLAAMHNRLTIVHRRCGQSELILCFLTRGACSVCVRGAGAEAQGVHPVSVGRAAGAGCPQVGAARQARPRQAGGLGSARAPPVGGAASQPPLLQQSVGLGWWLVPRLAAASLSGIPLGTWL